MIKLYGIKNCDAVKKARAWLSEQDVDYQFHDFRVEGADADLFREWLNTFGADRIINRRGTTWRKLSEEEKDSSDVKDLVHLMMRYPAIIKRPVFDFGAEQRLGFAVNDREDLESALNRTR